VHEKADPFAFLCEPPPGTASVVWDASYSWQDSAWMDNRRTHNSLSAPISAYEVHLGSWRRGARGKSRWPTYVELADGLSEYVGDMGYSHVELMSCYGASILRLMGISDNGLLRPD